MSKGIMFNESYGLESATLNGSKTRTTRNELDNSSIFFELLNDDNYMNHSGTLSFDGIDTFSIDDSYNHYDFKTIYKVGDIVAIKQSYKSIRDIIGDIIDGKAIKSLAGWNNKMFVKASLMPHQIQITDIKLERLQNISNEDCIKEGIFQHISHNKVYYTFRGIGNYFFDTPRDAFAALIDRISGRGTWDRNEYHVVYYYKLVK